MIPNDILKKQIVNKSCGHWFDTLEEMIDTFENDGNQEFYHNGITYYVWRQETPDYRYLPAIGTNANIETWTFFETWEDLVEQYKFPDGKTMLDIIFEYDY